jgi:WD40 repeat protein
MTSKERIACFQSGWKTDCFLLPGVFIKQFVFGLLLRENRPYQKQLKQMAILKGHTGSVHSLAFSNNGKWLASGGGCGLPWGDTGEFGLGLRGDGTVLLWEINLSSRRMQ